jgi:hypothetical protein
LCHHTQQVSPYLRAPHRGRSTPDRTSIEARLPDTFPDESWPEVLTLLETADWFGLAGSTTRGRSLWAAIRKSAPAATAAADAPHKQP